MIKFIYWEILFFILLILFFLLPSIAKLPTSISCVGDCPSCDEICEYDVEYINIYFEVPPNLNPNNDLCNVRSALKITKPGSPLNPYLNEIELIKYRPSPYEHTLLNGYWFRQIALDNPIPEEEAEALTEKNLKFVIKLCYNNICQTPLERIYKPYDNDGLNFKVVRVSTDIPYNILEINVEIKYIYDTGICEECCD